MKGFNLPLDKSSAWWSNKCKYIKEKNGHLFLEKLFFDDELGDMVNLHMLIPTQWGLHINKKRNETAFNTVKHFIKKNRGKFNEDEVYSVMLLQESFMISCIICNTPCKRDSVKPYQVVVRLMGGFKNGSSWCYELLFHVLCRKCQSEPWHALLLITNDHCDKIQVLMDQVILGDQLDGNDLVGPEYLKRFAEMNEKYIDILCSISVDNSVCGCYHCKRHGKNNPNLVEICPKCRCVYFCCDGTSGDKRIRGTYLEEKTCMELSHIYHDPMCRQLVAKYLFHVLDAFYVLHTGMIEAAIKE
jgi:hypothetical protein